MNIGIHSVGLATAQGNAADILNAASLRAPGSLPWSPSRWATCDICRPALGVDPSLSGAARWQQLAKLALEDCLYGKSFAPGTPLVVASGNGAADGFDAAGWQNAFDTASLLRNTPWADQSLPVVSASCASGLQALYLATKLLAAHDEVFVLAVDILSAPSHENFEALRVLSANPAPWQNANAGFVPGEAAVALRLTRNPGEMLHLSGPVLRQDLGKNSGLTTVLATLLTATPQLIIGQGSGPSKMDQLELDALARHVDLRVPLTTCLLHFGHTNGASGLLSIALAALAQRTSGQLPTLSLGAATATDGRPLADLANPSNTLILCRSLSGACSAAVVSRSDHPGQPHTPPAGSWQATNRAIPLMSPLLRSIAADALRNRPPTPPDLLVVRLERPIAPPRGAQIGGRLLPSAILEITPGFIPQLIARCWGFTGAAICLVGDDSTKAGAGQLLQACRKSGLVVCSVEICGSGEGRHVDWNI
jgi:hypothetical protein